MRTPVPVNGHANGHDSLVRAVFASQRESAARVRREPVPLDDDDEITDDLSEAVGNEAPWSPVPVGPGRAYVRASPEAKIDIVFPTVYEEDRSAKLKDLATAQAVGSISHQRMSEQMAKELGFEQYSYTEELRQIQIEMKKLPKELLGATDEIAGAPNASPVQPPAQATRMQVGAPTPGLANDDPAASMHRADLSGDSAHDFRHQQRTTESTDRLYAQMLSMRRDFIVAMKEASEREGRLLVALESARRPVEPAAPPNVTVHPPNIVINPPDIKVDAPSITIQPPQVHVTVEAPKPKNIIVARDERGLMTGMHEAETPPQ